MLCLFDAAMSNTHPTGSSQSLLMGAPRHSPRHLIRDHQAAVKALAWCPWQRNTLASGGGTADKTIRIWNTADGTNIKCTDTGSQVRLQL
jgi:cell division cycle protein 20 (cofactor of APC complex)